MKWLACFVFIVRVTIPMGQTKTYEAKSCESYRDGVYQLVLTDGRKVVVPIMWTIIEEK